MMTTMWRRLRGRGGFILLVASLSGTAFLLTGCDALKGGTASKDDDAKKKKKKKKDSDDEDEEEEDEDEEVASATPSGTATAGPVETAAVDADAGTEPAGEDEVVRYPGQETPMGGTVRLKVPFKIHRAADTNSKELGSVASGTFVNLKANFSNWMLIEWPSGIGELSLGWIQLRNLNDPNVAVKEEAPPDAGLTKPDAGPDAGAKPDAGTVKPDAGKIKRPIINPIKKPKGG